MLPTHLDFSDLEKKYQTTFDTSFANFVYIGNLPSIDESKKEKLLYFLRKKNLFDDIDLVNFNIPFQDGLSLGYAFVEVGAKSQAELLVSRADGFKFDTKHEFYAMTFDEFQEVLDMPDSYEEPSLPVWIERPFAQQWIMEDPHALAQFTTFHWDKHGNAVQLMQMPFTGGSMSVDVDDSAGASRDCKLLFKRGNMCDVRIEWSPLGTFLVAFHVQGISLWMNSPSSPAAKVDKQPVSLEDSFYRVARFAHPSIEKCSFSGDERFLYTESKDASIIWNVDCGSEIFTFPSTSPFVFQWSKKGHFFFTLSCETGKLSVYNLIDNSPALIHTFPGVVVDAEWSNCKAQLAFWVAECENAPARVSIWECSQSNSKQGSLIKSKTLFSVKSCRFCWHPQDNFLALLVDRFNKNRKSSTVNFEIFRLTERDIPVDNIECPPSQTLIDFSWEPNSLTSPSQRFCTIFREDASGNTFLAFWQDHHDVKNRMKQFSILHSYERKSIDRLFWNPMGQLLIAANLGTSSSGNFELWDSSNCQLITSLEHEQMSQIQWAPNGLHFASISSVTVYPSAENGYIVWDLRGNAVDKHSIEKFHSFSYRPSPFPSSTIVNAEGEFKPVLSKKSLTDIINNKLEQYFVKFAEEDTEVVASSARSTAAERKLVVDAWNAWKSACNSRYLSLASQRTQLLASSSTASSEQSVDVEEIVEEVIDEQQIFCQ